MSILLDETTRVLVHGASGSIGRYQLEGMHRYGTHVVGAVSRTPVVDLEWLPTYPTITDAQLVAEADLLVSYASGRFVGATAIEAFQAGILTVVAVAEDVPMRDIVAARRAARAAHGRLIGPNTNGIFTPGVARVGFFSPEFGMPGAVGVISRSGTLSYGALIQMRTVGLGQSTVVGIGGGIARGTGAAEGLGLFDADSATRAVVYLGETGSQEEESLAEVVRAGISKPVIALIVGEVGGGQDGLGHAGAVIFDGRGDVASKRRTLEAAGVRVVTHLGELVTALLESGAITLEAEAR